MRLDLIPALETPPADAAPSRIRPAAPGGPASRRTVVKGLVIGAAAATLVPFDWMLSRREAAAVGPTSEWTRSDCKDYSSGGYDAKANNWPSSGYAACWGGWLRGGYPCNSNHRHFEGTRGDGPPNGEFITSHRVTTCKTKNAWRWTAHGNLYRCSDALTKITYYPSGLSHEDYTVARCGL